MLMLSEIARIFLLHMVLEFRKLNNSTWKNNLYVWKIKASTFKNKWSHMSVKITGHLFRSILYAFKIFLNQNNFFEENRLSVFKIN